MTTVGTSWRTYAKHILIGNFLGQEVGAVNSMAAKGSIARCVWFDLTAGNGVALDGEAWHKNCSPGIMAFHATKLKVPCWLRLYEIKPAPYGLLLENLALMLPSWGYGRTSETVWVGRTESGSPIRLEAIYGSGWDAPVDGIDATDAVVALNDPNAITTWAMRPSFSAEVVATGAWCFRTLCTLGCNAHGLKRMPPEERDQWFDLVDAQQKALPKYRDLLLAAIERDASQWAYLISTAAKWRGSTEKSTETAFRKVGRTMAMSWFRDSNEAFEDAKVMLFRTKKELRTNA